MNRNRKKTYARLIKKTLNEISKTPKDNPARFELLKERANKYLKKYEALR